MSEFTETKWRCDHCGKTVRLDFARNRPVGWDSATNMYGIGVHACPNCKQWIVEYARETGLTLYKDLA